MSETAATAEPLPETMPGVVLVGHGGPEMLVWREDLPVPRPAPTDVIVRVAAAAVNNTDINTRIGWYSRSGSPEQDAAWTGTPLKFPRIQGADVCGRIVAVGSDVDPARVGERVIIEPSLVEAEGRMLETPWYFGSECDGGFARYTRVAARHAHRVESPLTDVELASFPCSYSTAENLETRAGVTAGETVLVTGASGGVGSAAVQIARARGAKVIAVASSSKAEALREIGAERVIDRGADLVAELGPNSVDVVIDLVGGPGWPALIEVLRPRGRYAVSGAIAGPEVTLDLRQLYLKDLTFYGCTVLDPGVFATLVRRIERGEIKPLVAKTFPLREIAAAQEAFTEKRHVGKIVLTVD
ncbi:MAG: alcohol dehydrogenase [Alphaproteobacteria bacterium]|nr:MAG: alcohol dehydrogenase [Alphaproteobacteria bacterium]